MASGEEHSQKAFGWVARDTSGILSPFHFSRRVNGDDDITMKILYCGICHSDLHCARDDFGFDICPVVPGPMKYYGLDQPGKHLGVVELGGLGHIAVKFAKAFGMKVTVISTSSSKKKEAIEQLGADLFLESKDFDQMKGAVSTMDGIIDTVSAPPPMAPLFDILKPHGKLVVVGVPEKTVKLPIFPLLMGRKLVGGSIVGGMKETQEMIDFIGKHNMVADIEVISMDYVNTAMERLAKGDIKYRFVIDIADTLQV